MRQRGISQASAIRSGGALQWMIREPGDYEASLGLAGIKIVELHKFERCWLRRHDSGVMGNRECEEGELRTQGMEEPVLLLTAVDPAGIDMLPSDAVAVRHSCQQPTPESRTVGGRCPCLLER